MQDIKILIIGGTGTLGQEICRQLGDQDRIVIYSRDEYKQAQMRKEFPEGGDHGIRYFIGDVRDQERLYQAMYDVDLVIHAAAMKRIDTCEYEPIETMKTNIQGSMNVIKACRGAKVQKCILVSTDKAVDPVSIYGASKLVAEKLFISANIFKGTRFSVVRYGNVLGSRGSILQTWEQQLKEHKKITITDPEATRFFFTIQTATQFVLSKLESMTGGEIFIPKMESKSILEMALSMTSSANLEFTGFRCPEKLHEELITNYEATQCYDQGDCFCIYPEFHSWRKELAYQGKHVRLDFTYSSKDIS